MASTLSNLTHKVANKIEEYGNKNKKPNDPHSTSHGPHSSNVANQTDPRVGGYGNTQAHDTYGTNTGPGGVNSSNTHGSNTNDTGYNNPHSTNAGPHSSNIVNKLDPRVDSDRDGRNDPTSRTGGYGQTQQYGDGYGTATGPGGIGSTTTSTTHTTHGHQNIHNQGHTAAHNTATTGPYGNSNTLGNNPQSTNQGPHNSNLLNKLDPRVDSDRDGRNNPTSHVGGYGNTHESGHATGVSTNTGYGSSNTVGNNPNSTNYGPHGSNMMNTLDPRVDSDRDGRHDPNSRVGGYGQTHGEHGIGHTGAGYGNTTGSGYGTNTHNTSSGHGMNNNVADHPGSTNHGPHSSNLLNKLDPRVDSDRDGRDDPSSRVGGVGNTQAPKYY